LELNEIIHSHLCLCTQNNYWKIMMGVLSPATMCETPYTLLTTALLRDRVPPPHRLGNGGTERWRGGLSAASMWQSEAWTQAS
jgi:hypothetical protein